MKSLQDQLLKAGIVDDKKAKKIKQEKRKAAKSRPKGQPQTDAGREQARRAMAEKAERDRALNRQLQAQAQHRAIRAQIVQLISMNRLPRDGGDIPYQFSDGTKIKKLYVTAGLQDDLSRGRVAIAKLDGRYELLPAAAAEKIRQRDAQAIVLLNTRQAGAEGDTADEDDPYAQYVIPDDLMW
ncbi:MAG: DUF2058 domain-containing protein [Halioglobus sp.]|nr:DUF2058 domain-containing protein [Halioglobus sp.]